MSKIYKALARAEAERGSRYSYTNGGSSSGAVLLPEEPVTPVTQLPGQLEQYERLRVVLSLEASRSDSKCVMLVSALPGEGVSTVTLGLASTMAEASRQGVLVLDLANSGPALAAGLGVYPRYGVSELLAKEVTASEAIVETSVPHLFVLGRGRRSLDLSNSTSITHFEELIKAMRSDFDFVIVDGGSLETSPDSLMVATRAADSVILVVQAERTGTDTVRETSQRLTHAGANVRGIILNRRREYLPRFLAKRI